MVKEKEETKQFPFGETFKWLLWSGLIAPIPIWIQFFVLKSLSQGLSLSEFADKGEFAIYSASIFASALYLLSKNERASVIKGRGVFWPACIIGLLLAVLFYGIVTVSIFGQIPANLAFFRMVTSILFVAAIIFGFLITGFDAVRSPRDPMSPAKDEEKRLEDEFKKDGESR